MSNQPKIGIRAVAAQVNVWFITYRADQDSALIARSFTAKAGRILLEVPSFACTGTTVPVRVIVDGIIDSFKVEAGSTIIRNQTYFTLNMPSSGSGTLNLTATAYYCDQSRDTSFSINYSSSVSGQIGPPYVQSANGSLCQNAPRTFSVRIPSGYTSFVWKVNGTSVNPSSTNHPLSYEWIPPATGEYTISYEAVYPCQTVTASTTHSVSAAPPPVWEEISVSPTSDYCPGLGSFFIRAITNQFQGIYMIDLGNDGSIESYSSFEFANLGRLPANGLPIRVQYDNGCGGRLDTVFTYNPSLASDNSTSGSARIIVNPPHCRDDSVDVFLIMVDFPYDSVKSIQWSWDGDNWTPPSNRGSARLRIPTNSQPPWMLYCRFTANTPHPCLTPPSSPVVTEVSPFIGLPRLVQIGDACLSGGTVRLVPFEDFDSNVDFIQYVLPDGTVLRQSVDDTISVTVPRDNYVYSLIYQGYNSCSVTPPATYSITSPTRPLEVSAYSFSSVCPGEELGITATYRPDISLIDSMVAVLWNNQRVRMDLWSISYAYVTLTAPSVPGLYSVRVIGYSCAGNDTAEVRFQVKSPTLETATLNAPRSGCKGEPVTFQRTGTNAGVLDAYWSFGDGEFRWDTSLSVRHTYMQGGLYTVTLSLSNIQCNNIRQEHTIRIYDDEPTLSELQVTVSDLRITYSVRASDYEEVVWSFGDGNTATGLSGTHTYAAPGTYKVKVRATNPCGTTQDSVEIRIASLGIIEGANSWLVYPNPASQEVIITSPTYAGEVRVELYDMIGRLLQVEKGATVPVRMRLEVPAGLYSLRLISQEGVIPIKLQVE